MKIPCTNVSRRKLFTGGRNRANKMYFFRQWNCKMYWLQCQILVLCARQSVRLLNDSTRENESSHIMFRALPSFEVVLQSQWTFYCSMFGSFRMNLDFCGSSQSITGRCFPFKYCATIHWKFILEVPWFVVCFVKYFHFHWFVTRFGVTILAEYEDQNRTKWNLFSPKVDVS